MPYLRIVFLLPGNNHRLHGGGAGAGGGTYSGRRRCCCRCRRCCCRCWQLNENFELIGSFISAPSASFLNKQVDGLLLEVGKKVKKRYQE